MSAAIGRFTRRVSALLFVVLPLCARAEAIGAAADDVQRAIGRGEAAAALRASADLLARAPTDPVAVQARCDAVLETNGWKDGGAAVHAAIAMLAPSPRRDALDAVAAVNDAVVANDPAGALAIAQRRLADASLARDAAAEMHSVAARALLQTGRPDAAQAEAEAAHAAWHALPGVRARRFEVTLGLMLAQLAEKRGDTEGALALAAAAADVAAARFGPASALRLRASEQRAGVLEAADRFPEARELREALLKAARDAYGEHHLRTAQEEGALGAHLQRTGNYAPAREHFARAEAIMDALPDAGPRDRLILANNYANLLQEMGDEDAALAHYRRALDLVTDKRTRAIILANIGNTEFRLARYEQAIADFQLALPLREEADGKDSPGLSFALEGLGSSALALRRFAEAKAYFTRAVELRARGSAPNNSQLNVLNFGVALAQWGLGEDAAAFALAVTTAERQQDLLDSLATGFSEQQSVAFDNLLVPAAALAVTLAAEHGRADEIATAWRLVMVERGLIARTEARRLAIARASADPQLAALYRDWRAANAALGDGWMNGRTSAARMGELQGTAEAAERELWARLGYRQDADAGAALPIAQLAQALPEHGVLVAFTEGVGRNAARIVNAGSAQMAEDLYAFVLRPGAAPALVRIGTLDALGAQTRAWYALLRDPHSDEAQLRRRGADLRRDLLGPAQIAAGDDALFVVPTGELFRISFAALPAPEGERYWIETGLRVHTLAHESELTLSAPPQRAARVLLAGAPEFAPGGGHAMDAASRQLCARVAADGFAPIPGAARELDGLRDVLHAALGEQAQVDLIDGARATKEHVFAALDGADIIHLATHGFSFDESCGGEGARGLVLERSEPARSPEVQALSGLAFAGADVGSGHAPIGVLSAGELSAADLSHADWVALSACDSGLGPIGHHEGVFGMRRALRLAGARTVVMSLWEADDAATADLMHALYRARFAERRDVPTAMAQAMRATLTARRAAGQPTHPYYWAAFVSEGGWR